MKVDPIFSNSHTFHTSHSRYNRCTAVTEPVSFPFITIIIPSIGRVSLRRSLKSLDRQSDSDFDAVLVLDGLNAENLPPDITEGRPWLCIEEAGETVNLEHRAGDMRNMGISRATGLFVGFLDDDDTLSPNYVSALKEEIALHSDFPHSPDVVLFRMYRSRVFAKDYEIIPPYFHEVFHNGWVGISFAVKRATMQGLHGVTFTSGKHEDFDLLDNLRRQGRRIVMSRYITYFVRCESENSISMLKNIDSFVIESSQQPSILNPATSVDRLCAERSDTIDMGIIEATGDSCVSMSHGFVDDGISIVILSRRGDEGRQSRNNLRSTWLQHCPQCLFFIGAPSCVIPLRYRVERMTCVETGGFELSEEQVKKHHDREILETEALLKESSEHGDMVLLPEHDGYEMLAIKLKAALRWVLMHKPNTRWIVKVDDDVYVRPTHLAQYLACCFPMGNSTTQQSRLAVVGNIAYDYKVYKFGKTPELRYQADIYPPFPIGSRGYALSRSVIDYIIETDEVFSGEDTSIGIWIEQWSHKDDVNWIDTSLFTMSGDCRDESKLIVGHDIPSEKLELCFRSDVNQLLGASNFLHPEGLSRKRIIRKVLNGRLGNQMFQVASTIGLASLQGVMTNQVCFLVHQGLTEIGGETVSSTFHFNIKSRTCESNEPIPILRERGYALHDQTILRGQNKDVEIDGYLQSYKYFEPIEEHIRQMFKFQQPMLVAADEWVTTNIPHTTNRLVCIHGRFGDHEKLGYLRRPRASWYRSLIAELNSSSTSFLLFSDDFDRFHFSLGINKGQAFNVFKSKGNTPGVDMAIIATHCDDIIISRGTFGWWAAYLSAKRANVWYSDEFVMKHDINAGAVAVTNYYPATWIRYDPEKSVPNINEVLSFDIRLGNGGTSVQLLYETVSFHLFEDQNVFDTVLEFCHAYSLASGSCAQLRDDVVLRLISSDTAMSCKCPNAQYAESCRCGMVPGEVLTFRREVLLNHRFLLPSSKGEYHAMVLYSSGFQYFEDIISIVRNADGMDIVRIGMMEVTSMEDLIFKLYRKEYELHPEHILSKLSYLKSLHLQVCIVVVRDSFPLYGEYGVDEDWKVMANKNIVDLKWIIRKRFNPPAEDGRSFSHHHVVHFTDTQDQAEEIFAFVPGLPSNVNTYAQSHSDFYTPYHDLLSDHKNRNSYSMRLINISQLRVSCGATQGDCVKGEVVPVELSPHFQFLAMSNESTYSQYYLAGLQSGTFVDDHTVGAFWALVQNFNPTSYGGCFRHALDGKLRRGYIIVDENMKILDGVHRAALLMLYGIQFIDVVVANGKMSPDDQIEHKVRRVDTCKGTGMLSATDVVSLGLRSLDLCNVDVILIKVPDPDTFPIFQESGTDIDILISPQNSLDDAVACLQGSFLSTQLIKVDLLTHWQLDVYIEDNFVLKFDMYQHFTYKRYYIDPLWVKTIFLNAHREYSPAGLLWKRPSWSDEAALRWLEHDEWVDRVPSKIKHLHWIAARPWIKFSRPEEGHTPYRNEYSRQDSDN